MMPSSQIMLCGNPHMVKNTTNVLIERGLKNIAALIPAKLHLKITGKGRDEIPQP
jgi:hypothetical protein